MSQSSVPAGGAAVVQGALAQLAGALEVLGSAPWWQLGEGELARAVVGLHGLESRVAAVQVGALGEVGARGLPAAAGAKDVAGWLRALVPVTPQHAAARAALAQAGVGAGMGAAGDEVAATREAFRAGRISPGHAGVLTRTMAAVAAMGEVVDERTRAEAQDLLLGAAGRVDPAQLAKAGLRLRHVLDPDAPARLARDEDAQHQARAAYLVQESSGMWLLRALMPAVEGAKVQASLHALARPRPATDNGPDPRTGPQRLADALSMLAELSLTARTGQPGALPARGGAPTRLILTTDLTTLLTTASNTDSRGLMPGTVHTGDPGGWPVSPLTVQTLACDAEILPILIDDHTGRPLDVGDTQYPFPPRIRRAIEHRDQHCTYPGCTAPPPWCHAHHITPYTHSRRTAEDNGTLLCGRHHRHVHAHHWTARLIDGHVHWEPPNPHQTPPPANAYTQHIDNALRQLAHRWHTRTHTNNQTSAEASSADPPDP